MGLYDELSYAAHIVTSWVIMEAQVDLADLMLFGMTFNMQSTDALARLVAFAAEVMTQEGPAVLKPRLRSLLQGTTSNPATEAEAALVAFAKAPSFPLAIEALRALARQNNARVYRPDVLYCCLRAMQMATGGSFSFADATVRERERHRHDILPLARRAIESNLLLKGLKAEVAVITAPEEMDARHLYVAFIRGSKKLVVCLFTSLLTAR
ncbi:hypothetical protein LO908_002524 [Aeromonas hydrophila]|nr:hypothetical protein [Aeromonas hydrophila]